MGINLKAASTFLFVIVLICQAARGQTFTNGSFETGTFTGWQTAGVPTVLGSPPVPASGSFHALINSTGTTAPAIYAMSNAVSASALETFLSTTLPGNANGSAINGEAIQQTFSTVAGATITFSYKYVSREAYQNGYDETGYVLNGVFHDLANSDTPGQTTAEATGFFTGGLRYKTVTITVGPGTNTLGFVAYNTGNTNAPTGLFIDNVVVTPLPTTTYMTIDPPGASSSHATGVFGNSVVGYYNSSGYLYDGSTIIPLNVPQGNLTKALGVSNKNVVGVYNDSGGVEHGFIYDGMTYTTLDPPGSQDTQPIAVSGGTVAGLYQDAQSKTHGFFYGGTNFVTLDPAGDTYTEATAISGTNVGGIYGDGNGMTHGFLYDGTTYTTIDPPGSTNTFVTGMAGAVVAGYYFDNNNVQHGFLRDGTTYTTLDPPGSTSTQVSAMYGPDVVGWYVDSGGINHGFVYDGSAYTTIDPPTSIDTEISAISGTNVAGWYFDGTQIHGFGASLSVGKTAVPVTLDQFSTTYDGTPKAVAVTTVPGNLNAIITYDGSVTPPTQVGDYAVVATVNDASYQGLAAGTLSIGKVNASLVLGNLTAVYDGLAKVATGTTTPPNLAVAFTYNGSSTPPVNVGSYNVNSVINDSTYQGTAFGTLMITQGTATVTLESLSPPFDGTPKSATATTNPAGLNVAFTYDGSSTPPSAVGSYTVIGTVSDANYQGSATGTLVISAATSGTFSDWETSYSITGELPTDTPLNDGVPNLLKYLYNIDPTRAMTASDRTAFPVLGTVLSGNTTYLTLTYRRNALETDLGIKLQKSTDLQTWTTVDPPDFSQQIGTDAVTGDPIMQIGVTAQGSPQFIRLQITLP